MMRMNRLIGLPVVLGHKRVGTVEAVSLTPCGHFLAGIHVQCGLQGMRYVPVQAIRLLGGVSVLIDAKPVRGGVRFQLGSVVDTSGLRLGVVTDALLEEEAFSVVAVEVSFGLVDDVLQGRRWARAFTVDPRHGDVVVASRTDMRTTWTEGGIEQ